ncbi:oligosaccharide flippase family protein [Hwanghaeella sp.]|uniref:oligosaccharide flippase family protein n=1 Tax=Hwanghaeella sp. TaxID=2605943 RepID=UPI003CCC1423
MSPSSKFHRIREALRKPAEARSLTEKTLISGALITTETVASTLVRIVSSLVLTRLLGPDVFGAAVVLLLAQYILAMLTDLGIRSLIFVSDNNGDPNFLRTCWTLAILRGAILGASMVCIGIVLYQLQQQSFFQGESVYRNEDLPGVMAALGLQFLILGFASTNEFVYEKHFRMRLVVIIKILQQVTTTVVCIIAALIYPSIWAIGIGMVTSAAVRTALTHCLLDGPRMKPRWQKEHVAELVSRGKWVASHSILYLFSATADQILFSIFLPAQGLGLYYLAKQIISIPAQFAEKLNSSLTLQFFVELKERMDVEAFRKKYYRYRVPYDIVLAVCSGGALIAGPTVIDILYDPRYASAGQILQILAVGLPLTAFSIIGGAFNAYRQFRIMAVFYACKTVAIWAGLIVALVYYENETAAFAVVSLHRLVEVVAMLLVARARSWVSILQEARIVPLFAVGMGLGWVFLEVWGSLRMLMGGL